MVKYKALQSFTSESLGYVGEGEIKDITVTKADEINNYTQGAHNIAVLERVEEPKKAGKK